MHSIYDLRSYDIEGKGLPDDVLKKVTFIHVPFLADVQQALHYLDIKIGVSLRSAYRSKEWERKKGRSGYSEHTFNGLGAVDVTCNNFKENKDELLKELINCTLYTRIAVYNSFIHVDLKNKLDNRWVYNSKWVRQYKI